MSIKQLNVSGQGCHDVFKYLSGNGSSKSKTPGPLICWFCQQEREGRLWMKWRNYKPQNFWLGVTWHFPQAIYTNDRKAPLVSRLPHVLRHGFPPPQVSWHQRILYSTACSGFLLQRSLPDCWCCQHRHSVGWLTITSFKGEFCNTTITIPVTRAPSTNFRKRHSPQVLDCVKFPRCIMWSNCKQRRIVLPSFETCFRVHNQSSIYS